MHLFGRAADAEAIEVVELHGESKTRAEWAAKQAKAAARYLLRFPNEDERVMRTGQRSVRYRKREGRRIRTRAAVPEIEFVQS